MRTDATPQVRPSSGLSIIGIRVAVFIVMAGIFAWSWANGWCH